MRRRISLPRCLVLGCAIALWAAPAALGDAPASARRLTDDGRLKMDLFVVDDGTAVVYTVQEEPELLALMRLDLATGKSEKLHASAETNEFEPSVSADDRYCAFVQNRGNLNLRLVIRDRRAQSDAFYHPRGGFAGVRHPSISPDGSRVICSAPCSGGQHIVAIGIDGDWLGELTNGESLNGWPSFSPDGTKIAFGSSRDGNYELYVMDAKGGNARRLTDHAARDMRPRWSPDGRRLAWTSARDGNSEIYVMNLDDCLPVRLTDHPEQDDYAAWLPDGRRLLIVSERAGQFDLYELGVSAR